MEETAAPGSTPSRRLGRGRSGVVYRCRDPQGRDVARKVFVGDTASNLVHWICSGAPNPYRWNEDAIHCALLRRRIVATLVEVWFGGELEVADAWAVGWDATARAWFLDTRFVDGRTASLHHPFSAPRDHELRGLRRRVMRPLQRRLAEAGLDGLVWQAGRGNPVATNNFLLRTDADRARWVWIDLESGVPALAALNPLDLFGFYVPRSFRHGRPLFDDVDVERLRRWIESDRERLGALGPERLRALHEDVAQLDAHQSAWRAQRRLLRSIEYRRRQGRIDDDQAAWYAERPLRWYAHELRGAVQSATRRLASLVRRGTAALVGFPYRRAVTASGRFLISQRYRAALARLYVGGRIDAWLERGQLTGDESQILHRALADQGVGSFITDFGVHVAIKPAVKALQWTVLPALFAAGVIPASGVALLIVFGGMIGRTAYTLGRMIQAFPRDERLPWVALGIGVLPIAGNAAYPAQIVWTGSASDGKLAGFILYDTVTRVGERIPIWGGRDTATEHAFNRLADPIVRDRRP